MGEDKFELLDLRSVPVRSASVVEVWATVFCWTVFVVGAVFIPARSVVLGLAAGVSLFGIPLQGTQLSEVRREFLVGSISATAAAAVILTLTVLMIAQGRRLESGWVAGALASGVAVVAWVLVALHPTLSA